VKTSEAQETTREWSNLNFLQNCPFWAYIKKKSAHSLFGARSFFLVHIRFTPSKGPKAFKTNFLRSRTMEVGPWTQTIEKGPLPWSDFMVHSVNQPLVWWSMHIILLAYLAGICIKLSWPRQFCGPLLICKEISESGVFSTRKLNFKCEKQLD
jgi:hypothetical protein